MSEPTRTYYNAGIIVEWREELCVHCGACVEGLPAVFDLSKRPWVNVGAASPEAVAEQVDECPSGALKVIK